VCISKHINLEDRHETESFVDHPVVPAKRQSEYVRDAGLELWSGLPKPVLRHRNTCLARSRARHAWLDRARQASKETKKANRKRHEAHSQKVCVGGPLRDMRAAEREKRERRRGEHRQRCRVSLASLTGHPDRPGPLQRPPLSSAAPPASSPSPPSPLRPPRSRGAQRAGVL
jgi:hypothetical protein